MPVQERWDTYRSGAALPSARGGVHGWRRDRGRLAERPGWMGEPPAVRIKGPRGFGVPGERRRGPSEISRFCQLTRSCWLPAGGL